VGPGLYVHAHHGHPFLWVVVLLLFLALIAFAVYFLVRMTRGAAAAPAATVPGDAALESVRMRYARGEIDRDEFIRVSTDLGAPPPAVAA
jgi:uncharacterized membrane protein